MQTELGRGCLAWRAGGAGLLLGGHPSSLLVTGLAGNMQVLLTGCVMASGFVSCFIVSFLLVCYLFLVEFMGVTLVIKVT